ncbi:MAG: hypothetical protein KF763_06370 [Cyclobacteriaceae bacterium]|nr:hypothetical protein [Cyclobacteriaceae bacterium]
MTFEEYLIGKKIDGAAFQATEPALWNEWNKLFEQMSPASFTSQKLYLINPIRRKYHLKVEATETPKLIVAAKPVMKPKPKMN